MRLKDIATVSSGVSFRDRVVASPSGNMSVIQMKDIGRDNRVRFDRVTRMDHSMPRSHPRQLARPGDLVFRSRGRTNMAALLTEEARGMAVAMPLFRIRPDKNKAAPEYLLWWMNQPSSQRYFASQSEGTFVKMINKQSLENLEVKLPPLAVQHKIAALFELAEQEQRLLETIKQRKKLQAHGILMRMASEARLTASNETPGVDSPGSTNLTNEVYIMSVKIVGYDFDGPFASPSQLASASGVYSILCKKRSGEQGDVADSKGGQWDVVYAGESKEVRDRVTNNHEKASCWRSKCLGELGYAAYYCDESSREAIESRIIDRYDPPCNK